jgi:anti-sigma B factor antagonist
VEPARSTGRSPASAVTAAARGFGLLAAGGWQSAQAATLIADPGRELGGRREKSAAVQTWRAMSTIEITERRCGVWTVLQLGGELDTVTAGELRDRLAHVIAAGLHRLVVDLDRLVFLDSSGLSVLVGGLRAVRQQGGALRLVCTHPRWRAVLTTSGLDRVLPVYASAADATADTGGPD